MLTAENYFSKENQMKYFGTSQFKAFDKCEAAALAEIRGEYEREKTTALLVGSYVDAHFEGTLDIFRAKNPDLFTRPGELKTNFRQAEEIIQRLERDELFMEYMSGQPQAIMTGELFGYPWKIKIDSYHQGKAIVDLKVMKDFAPIWVDGEGKIPFVEAWEYDLQAAIYQAVEGNHLPFIIAGATKEKTTDLALFRVPQQKIDVALKIIEAKIDRFADIKAGIVESVRCEKCDYCKQTKVLTSVVPYEEAVNE
ncbi:MAG: PD-(D/E)XK nuclease-like domain-containing protein [Anaerovoracaceae bacterium]